MAKLKKFSMYTDKIGMLKEFLDRFKKVNTSLLLEVHEECIVSKTHTPDRGFIKRSKMEFDGFCTMEDDRDGKIIKVPFFSIQRVIKNIDILGEGEIEVQFLCEETNNFYVCRDVKFVTTSLTLSNKCTELDYVTSMSDEIYERVIKSAVNGASINISKSVLSKIYSLFDADSEETISLKFDGDLENVVVFTPMYEYRLEAEVKGKLSNNVRIKKNCLQYIGDSSDISLGIYEDKIVATLIQDGSETTSIIGAAENED
jgi:hypothetical protein